MARPRHEAHAAIGVGRTDGGRGREPGQKTAGVLLVVAVVGSLVLITFVGLPRLFAQQPPTPSPTTSGATAAETPVRSEPASPTPRSAAATAVPGRSPSRAPRTPPVTPTTHPSPAATPLPTRDPDAAPASAAEFDLRGQVIRIGFPLKDGARYQYRDNFRDPREGEAHSYNHARVRRGDRLLRAHDGTDIYAAEGTPVVAPFDGVVIDPSTRWKPWIPDRYGRTAVIQSTESASEGYATILSHLAALYVEPGQVVHRGEVIGLVGATGNADGGRPHLHFELRAPFPLSWEQVGEDRLIDAFNPYPSLRAADPRDRN